MGGRFFADLSAGSAYNLGMAFAGLPEQQQSIDLLQRSLERGRLGHAYLFIGQQLPALETLARTLAKTLNCENPVIGKSSDPALNGGRTSLPIDCCDICPVCQKIDQDNHADIHWVRAESKSRIVTVDQMRELMREVYLKPNDAQFKVAVISAADRLNVNAANAFLKTLEEPPSKCILILLTTAPERILETIISRCLRLNFSIEQGRLLSPSQLEWLQQFGEMAAAEQKSLLSRYRLLGSLLNKLAGLKEKIDTDLTARSPLQRYDDVDPDLQKKWEGELDAAIEAEYRLQRSDLLLALQWWFRDVWIQTQAMGGDLLNFPQIPGAQQVASRINAMQATQNLETIERLQRMLGSNVQEALALEVGLLKLHL